MSSGTSRPAETRSRPMVEVLAKSVPFYDSRHPVSSWTKKPARAGLCCVRATPLRSKPLWREVRPEKADRLEIRSGSGSARVGHAVTGDDHNNLSHRKS